MSFEQYNNVDDCCFRHQKVSCCSYFLEKMVIAKFPEIMCYEQLIDFVSTEARTDNTLVEKNFRA